MPALADRRPRAALKGHSKPRIAPPVPARSGVREFTALASKLGIDLYPWQQTAARYLTAETPGDAWLYREIAIIVARQNGKTTLLLPLIISRLLAGHRITHAAQTREFPRVIHEQVGELLLEHFRELVPGRRGIRYGAGQEEIRLSNGGVYRIVAASRGGARGQSNDLVIIDEVREFETFEFIGAAKPTLTASAKPQMVYLSNAGTEESVVLNSVKMRAGRDESLAYLEWSTAPDRGADDPVGWCEANPAVGHKPGMLDSLAADYRSAQLGGTMAEFETEHLCRWVVTMRQRLVDEFAWNECEVDELVTPPRPVMAVSMDPKGRRAAAAIAWTRPDRSIGLQLLLDATGEPIDVALLGKDLVAAAAKLGVAEVGFDQMTDAELAKYFKRSTPITGSKFANATARFATAVSARMLAWSDAAAVGDDLVWTARKPHAETGSYQAVRSDDDHPIPAALAAIRAIWLASGPRPGKPRIR